MSVRTFVVLGVTAIAVSACAYYAPAYPPPGPIYTTPGPVYAPAAYPGAIGWYQDPAYGRVYVGWGPATGYYYMGGPNLSVSVIGRPIPYHYHSHFHYFHGHSYRGWRR